MNTVMDMMIPALAVIAILPLLFGAVQVQEMEKGATQTAGNEPLYGCWTADTTAVP